MTEWTNNTWNLFHTMAEKVKENEFNNIRGKLFYYIKGICSKLPCPDCSHHATIFMANVRFENIQNKDDLKNLFFIFHNNVNKRINKPVCKKNVLEQYKNKKFHLVLNDFFQTFTTSTKGNFTFMSENYNRKIFIDDFLSFMKNNINRFDN